MDSAGLRWYRTGTVNITQGSTNVIGVGTNWQTAGIQPGDVFMVGNSVLYEIAEVADNTNIVLHNAFQGATGTGQNYSILRNFAGTMQAQIAAQVAELINKYESYIDTELDQIVGPPGPTSFPYRGTWAAGRQYDALDVVEYQGALYMAIAPHTSTTTNAPGATETEWVILSVAVGGVMTTSFTKGAEVAPSGSNGISVIGKNDASDITLSATDGAIRLQQTSGGTTTTVTEFTRAEITALSARVTTLEGPLTVKNGGVAHNFPAYANGAGVAPYLLGSGITTGLRVFGKFEKETTTGYNLESVLFYRNPNQILQQAYNEDTGTWETLATYTADDDTGWIVLDTTAYPNVFYRRKNGVVFVNGDWTTDKAYGTNDIQIKILPTGFHPVSWTCGVLTILGASIGYQPMGMVSVYPDGLITLLANQTGVESEKRCVFNISYPV